MKVEDILKECRDELRRLGIRIADPYKAYKVDKYWVAQVKCNGATFWYQLPKSRGGAIIGWWNTKTGRGEFVPQGLSLEFDKRGNVIVTYVVERNKK